MHNMAKSLVFTHIAIVLKYVELKQVHNKFNQEFYFSSFFSLKSIVLEAGDMKQQNAKKVRKSYSNPFQGMLLKSKVIFIFSEAI